MEDLFVWLAIFIWVALGALIVLAAWSFVEWRRRKRGQFEIPRGEYAPYAELLGKPCWLNDKKNRHRVVAVSHKGAVCVRDEAETGGEHGFWVPAKRVPKRVRFGEERQ